MIDTDSRGLIGPDESEASRQDLWLSSCCQMKRRLKPPRSAKTHTHTPPSLIWPPLAVPLSCQTVTNTHTPHKMPALTQQQIKLHHPPRNRAQSPSSNPERRVHHRPIKSSARVISSRMSPTANHLVNDGFITVIVKSEPPVSRSTEASLF